MPPHQDQFPVAAILSHLWQNILVPAFRFAVAISVLALVLIKYAAETLLAILRSTEGNNHG
jgi:hypothetical protein